MRAGRPVRVESDVFWRKDSVSFPVEYSASPIRENGVLRGAVVTFVDITARRQQERLMLVRARRQPRQVEEDYVGWRIGDALEAFVVVRRDGNAPALPLDLLACVRKLVAASLP